MTHSPAWLSGRAAKSTKVALYELDQRGSPDRKRSHNICGGPHHLDREVTDEKKKKKKNRVITVRFFANWHVFVLYQH